MDFEKQLEQIKSKADFLQTVQDLPGGSGCMLVIEYPEGHDPSHSFKSYGDRTVAHSTHLLQTGIFYLHGLYNDD